MIRFNSRIAARSLSMALALVALVGASALTAPEAQARERMSTASGPNGHSATRKVNRANGDVSSSTVNNQTGNTLGSRTVDRSTAGTQGSVTGAAGNTTTRSTTPTGSGPSTTVTGPNGRSGTVDTTVTR